MGGVRLMVLGLLLAGAGFAAHAEGALATGPGQRSGFGYNYRSGREAQDRALYECGRGCSVKVMFRHACAAYAADRTRGSTVFGWAEAPSSRRAERNAIENCESYGGNNCRVTSYCDE